MGDDLVNRITSITATNRDIIERINEKANDTVLTKISYFIQSHLVKGRNGCYRYTVTEKPLKIKGAAFVKKYKMLLTLKVPIDLFNDRLDYKCETYPDMCRLNESMALVIEKYCFLDPSRAHTELTKFFHNFEAIQMGLLEVDRALVSEEYTHENKLSYYQRELEDINERMNMIFMNTDVNLKTESKWLTPCTSHVVVGNKATLISGQYGCLLSTDGYSSGIVKWNLRIISRTSTCMLGVAPASVSKSGPTNNYCTNGFYMDLNGGTLYSGPPLSYSARSFLNKSVETGCMLSIILNFDTKSITYVLDGKEHVAYENLVLDKEYFLAWDNNTTPGTEIELIDSE